MISSARSKLLWLCLALSTTGATRPLSPSVTAPMAPHRLAAKSPLTRAAGPAAGVNGTALRARVAAPRVDGSRWHQRAGPAVVDGRALQVPRL
jgi:hypothetical protein